MKPKKKFSAFVSKISFGVAANAYGQAVTLAIQILSVPIFIYYWGMERYGEWLMLTAVPVYLLLSDFGVGAIAANKMVAFSTVEKKDKAVEVFSSANLFVLVVSILMMSIYLIYYIAGGGGLLFSDGSFEARDIDFALLFLVVQVIFSLNTNMLSAAYRAQDRYAEGMVYIHSARLFESLLSIFALISTRELAVVCASACGARIFVYLIMRARIVQVEPAYSVFVSKASFYEIKRMLSPAFAFLAFPLGLAFSVQGLTIAIGSVLGAVAVAQFTALRTVSRVLVQISNVFSQSLWPEITRAFEKGNHALVSAVRIQSFRGAFLVGLLISVVIYSFANEIFELWVGSELTVDRLVLMLLLGVALVNVMGQPSWVLLMATSNHKKFSILFLVSSFMVVLLSIFLMPYFGLLAVGGVLLSSELLLFLFSLSMGGRVLNESNFVFLKRMFQFSSGSEMSKNSFLKS